MIYFVIDLGGTFNTVSGVAEFLSIDSCVSGGNQLELRIKQARGEYYDDGDVIYTCIKK